MNAMDEPGRVWRLTGPRSMAAVVHNSYTTEDVAAALGIAPSTVRAYGTRGQMPAPTGRLGRTPYWNPEDIEPWIEARRKHLR